MQRQYQTIDPLILQTLNLNQKRIHHIFDILHGRDSKFYAKSIVAIKGKKHSMHSVTNGRLPNLNRHHQSIQITKNQSKRQGKSLSTSFIEAKAINHSISLQNIEEEMKAINLEKSRKQSNSKATNSRKKSDLSKMPSFAQKKSRMIMDYGANQIVKSRSVEINPKDIYKLQIQGLVSKKVEIQNLQQAEKAMKRLKKRFQHLRKFDKQYYSRLCANQIELL